MYRMPSFLRGAAFLWHYYCNVTRQSDTERKKAMALPHITPRRVAPYLLSGVSGVHILVRMWRLNRQPVSNGPVHVFLLKHTDVVLVLTGMPVMWHLAQRHGLRAIQDTPDTQDTTAQPVIMQVAHQLRQVFTSLLLGLGLIERKIINRQSYDIPSLVHRLQNIVAEGIQTVNVLDPPGSFGQNGTEEELEA
jgi:hypothetical protein